jgi:hypothetical protein
VSLTSPVPDDEGILTTAVGRACCYCELPLHDPAVVWHGPDGPVMVHGPCVAPWFLRLARDAHEIENPAYYARRVRGRA